MNTKVTQEHELGDFNYCAPYNNIYYKRAINIFQKEIAHLLSEE